MPLGSNSEVEFEMTPVIDGIPDPSSSLIINNNDVFEGLITPGTWHVRGILARLIARDRLIEIQPGGTTELVFDFAVSQVYFDFQGDGTPIRAGVLYPHDGAAEDAWRETRCYLHPQTGASQPILLPVGTWLLRGGDYYNAHNRAEVLVEVAAPGQILTGTSRVGDQVDTDALGFMQSPSYTGCLERVRHGACLIEAVAF